MRLVRARRYPTLLPASSEPFPHLPIVAFVLVGCQDNRPRMGTIAGAVSFRGEPVGMADIHFRYPETGAIAWTPIGADGNFTIAYPVQVGTYTVHLVPPLLPQVPGQLLVTQPDNPRIPRKCRDERTSGLNIELKEGKNELQVAMTD